MNHRGVKMTRVGLYIVLKMSVCDSASYTGDRRIVCDRGRSFESGD